MDREWTFLPEAAAPFMLAAAQAIGLPADPVTSPPPGAAAGAARALGRELLRMVLGTQDGGGLPDVLAELVRDPDGQQAQEWLTEQAFEVFESDLAAADRAAAAVAAFHRRRADAGDVQALVDLGDLLYWDEPEAARAAYQEAVDAGHQHALLDLAKVVRREDEDAALAVLQQAAGSTDPDLSAEAMYDIADMHLSRQDADAAAAMFHQVIDTRHPEWAAAAMIGLGNVLRRHGDRDGAEALYRKAIQTGGKGSAHACWLLGHLLKGKGDLTGAEAAWQHGIEDGSSPSAAAAFTSLVNLLEHQGDVEGLRAAYLTGAALNNPDALYALTQLGQLLESQGDITGAQAAWQQAIDGGCEDPDYWRERMSPPPKRRPEPAPLSAPPARGVQPQEHDPHEP